MCMETIARVIELAPEDAATAVADVDGATRRISLAMLTVQGIAVQPGDWLLAHTGIAIEVLTEPDAMDRIRQCDEALAAFLEDDK